MLVRSCAAVAMLVVLVGCREGAGSSDPEGVRRARAEEAGGAVPGEVAPSEPPAEPEPAEPAEPEPAEPAEPKPLAEPEPEPDKPEPAAEDRVRVQGRTVEVRIDEQAPADEDAAPTLTFVVSIDGATQGDDLLSLPTGFEFCERSQALVSPVSPAPSPLVLAQAYCVSGEDEFSRDMLVAVIHVGDTATAPRVLWQGEGHYRNSFGVCEDMDIPLAEIARPGTLVVQQITQVVKNPDRDLPDIRCRARKARVRKKAEIGF